MMGKETVMMPRSERRYLTIHDKMSVIEKREKGISERKLAEEYKCSKTQINNIYKNRDVIRKDFDENINFSLKVKKKGTYEDINVQVYRWYCKMKNKNIRVTGPMLKKKALELAENCGTEKFRASNGWLYGFRNNYKIVFQPPNEINENMEDEEMGEEECIKEYLNEWMELIASVIRDYELRNIFSLDVTGLFYKSLPSKTLSITSKQCQNGKMASERLTVLLCTNGVGEKLPPLIIGKAKRPQCLNGINSGVTWSYNFKSLMNGTIFSDWLQDLNFKMSTENRKIILFIDNSPCKIADLNLGNVKVKFLPASDTSCLQPFEHGITKNFKLNYRKNQFEYLIARRSDETPASESSQKILILDAVRWIKKAWEEVKPTTIEKCFNLCGFKLLDMEIEEEVYETDLELLAKEAGTDFDEMIFEEETKLNCLDFTSEKSGSEKMETNAAAKEDKEPKMNELLASLDKIQRVLNQSGNVDNKGQMLTRVMDLKNDFEREIVRKKLEHPNEGVIVAVFEDCPLESIIDVNC